MEISRKTICFYAVVLAVFFLAKDIFAAAPSGVCTASGCHQGMDEKDVLHSRVIGCGECHIPVEQEHPREGKKTFQEDSSKGCLACHVRLVDFKKVHEPVGSGNCSACHVFHGSGPKKLRDMKEKDICMECHLEIIPEGSTVLHGPVAEGVCTKCHNPHGSNFEALAVREYSAVPYLGYTENEYQFCFECHPRQLLQFVETSYATEFRDGDKNLHFVHVNKINRGLSCKMCHTFHGSRSPKLMAEEVPYGKWMLPLQFTKTDTGGSCFPGCHKKEEYVRDKDKLNQQEP